MQCDARVLPQTVTAHTNVKAGGGRNYSFSSTGFAGSAGFPFCSEQTELTN